MPPDESTRRRNTWLIAPWPAVALVLALVGSACGGSSESSESSGSNDGPPTTLVGSTAPEAPAPEPTTLPSPKPTAPEAPGEVSTLQLTYVDQSRSTAAYADVAEKPSRTIETTVYLPAANDPAPLVLLAHGAIGSPDKFSELATTWAEAGYVVALPRFPLSSDADPRITIDDPVLQAGDLQFMTNELLSANDDGTGELAGRIDPEHIGAAGLSLGAVTTYVHAFASCCADDRVDAVLAMAGSFLLGEGADLGDTPVFVAHGDADPVLPYEGGVRAFESAGGDRFLLTALGGSHATPFQDEPTAYDESVRSATTSFWDLTLRGEADARQELLDAGVPGVTEIEQR